MVFDMLDICSKTQNEFNRDQKLNNALYDGINKIQNYKTKVTDRMVEYATEVE